MGRQAGQDLPLEDYYPNTSLNMTDSISWVENVAAWPDRISGSALIANIQSD